MSIIFGMSIWQPLDYGVLMLRRFFDDIELLRQRWHSENNDTVAEL